MIAKGVALCRLRASLVLNVAERYHRPGISSLFGRVFLSPRRRETIVEEQVESIEIERSRETHRCTWSRTYIRGYQATNSFATVLHTLTNRGNNENNFRPYRTSLLPLFLTSKRLVLYPRPGRRFFRLLTAAERAPERDR